MGENIVNYYEQMDEIDGGIIDDYLYHAVEVASHPDSIEYYRDFKASSLLLSSEIENMGININPRDMDRYLLNRAINIYKDLVEQELFLPLQTGLELLIEKMLKNEIKLVLPRNTSQNI